MPEKDQPDFPTIDEDLQDMEIDLTPAEIAQLEREAKEAGPSEEGMTRAAETATRELRDAVAGSAAITKKIGQLPPSEQREALSKQRSDSAALVEQAKVFAGSMERMHMASLAESRKQVGLVLRTLEKMMEQMGRNASGGAVPQTEAGAGRTRETTPAADTARTQATAPAAETSTPATPDAAPQETAPAAPRETATTERTPEPVTDREMLDLAKINFRLQQLEQAKRQILEKRGRIGDQLSHLYERRGDLMQAHPELMKQYKKWFKELMRGKERTEKPDAVYRNAEALAKSADAERRAGNLTSERRAFLDRINELYRALPQLRNRSEIYYEATERMIDEVDESRLSAEGVSKKEKDQLKILVELKKLKAKEEELRGKMAESYDSMARLDAERTALQDQMSALLTKRGPEMPTPAPTTPLPAPEFGPAVPGPSLTEAVPSPAEEAAVDTEAEEPAREAAVTQVLEETRTETVPQTPEQKARFFSRVFGIAREKVRAVGAGAAGLAALVKEKIAGLFAGHEDEGATPETFGPATAKVQLKEPEEVEEAPEAKPAATRILHEVPRPAEEAEAAAEAEERVADEEEGAENRGKFLETLKKIREGLLNTRRFKEDDPEIMAVDEAIEAGEEDLERGTSRAWDKAVSFLRDSRLTSFFSTIRLEVDRVVKRIKDNREQRRAILEKAEESRTDASSFVRELADGTLIIGEGEEEKPREEEVVLGEEKTKATEEERGTVIEELENEDLAREIVEKSRKEYTAAMKKTGKILSERIRALKSDNADTKDDARQSILETVRKIDEHKNVKRVVLDTLRLALLRLDDPKIQNEIYAIMGESRKEDFAPILIREAWRGGNTAAEQVAIVMAINRISKDALTKNFPLMPDSVRNDPKIKKFMAEREK